MNNEIKAAMAAALNFGAAEAEQYKPQVLELAQKANVGVQQAADHFIDSLGGALSFFRGPIKAAIDAQLGNGLAKEEDVIFELLVGAARNEAAKLAAH